MKSNSLWFYYTEIGFSFVSIKRFAGGFRVYIHTRTENVKTNVGRSYDAAGVGIWTKNIENSRPSENEADEFR